MREYKFKRGFESTSKRLEEMIKKHFKVFKREGEVYTVKFGALEELKLWIENKKLMVKSRTNLDVPSDVASITIKTYNQFLEELTGHTARERQKMIKKEAEKL
jgi:hypothetical protein